MANHTSFKVGGAADVYAMVSCSEALAKLHLISSEHGLDLLLIGNGTNLLFPDHGFRGVVAKLDNEFSWCRFEDTKVFCGAATPMSVLARKAAQNSLSGLEFSYGIPGTLGGGIKTNAGAHSWSIGQFVDQVEVVTRKGQISSVESRDLVFGYRQSDVARFLCVTEVVLNLSRSNGEEIMRTMEDLLSRRRRTQPLGCASAGCIFKNPVNASAGALIDRLGLKGTRIGGAEISKIHANFIVNTGSTKSSDILKLIDLVRDEVRGKTGIELELEIEVVK
jgi:UDP-N-acetylmuramate dehydrogenase